jgi:hypothetical protein
VFGSRSVGVLITKLPPHKAGARASHEGHKLLASLTQPFGRQRSLPMNWKMFVTCSGQERFRSPRVSKKPGTAPGQLARLRKLCWFFVAVLR